jgi:cytosine deaminase
LWDVQFSASCIRSITPTRSVGLPESTATIEAGGRVLLPGLVDAHVHLDKAYQLAAATAAGFDGDLREDVLRSAIAATASLRKSVDSTFVIPGMRRLLTEMRRTGTAAARVHVEIDPDTDTASVSLHQQVAAEFPDIALQLTAFPQRGTESGPTMHRKMEQALDLGCTVVGGCPYADPDPVSHLMFIFALAADRGLPIDLHADLTDDAALAQIPLILQYVERYHLEGRVTLGHMNALAAMPPDRFDAIARELARLRITIVVLPTTDLWLSGRTQRHNRVRGVAPIKELIERGVAVAIGSNNHQNAFTPVSGGGLLRQLWLCALVCHMGSDNDALNLLEAVTTIPASICGLEAWGIQENASPTANLVDCNDPWDTVRQAPHVYRRIARGQLC